ncbi:putative reverse transcriptase domain-containing protein [Tanacetum coccineum]
MQKNESDTFVNVQMGFEGCKVKICRVNTLVEFYEYLSDLDMKRKARDPMGYHGHMSNPHVSQTQEVSVSMSWNDFKFMMIQEFCPSHEMQKLESGLWNHGMVGASHAAYTDRFHELVRMVAVTELKTMQKAVQISGALTNEAVRNGSIKKVEKSGNVGETSKYKNGRENMGTWSKCTTCNSYHAPGGPCHTCFNCNRPGHLAKDCRGVPRNVNHVNARNPTVRAYYECRSTDHVRSACPRLNRAQELEGNHPNQIAANNEGQGLGNQGNQARASGQLVEIDKVIKGCKLEIEVHVFDIDLIPFVHESFDVIIGERPKEKERLLMSAKASDKKQEEIVVVRDFPEVFPDDLSGLSHIWEIEFWIELIPGETLVEKSPYRLAPFEMEELSG